MTTACGSAKVNALNAPLTPDAAGRTLVRLSNARLTYPARDGQPALPVLKDLSMDIRQGEHLALLGTNGAGKSTLLRLLTGEAWLDASGGSIAWDAGQGLETSPLVGRAMTALVSAAQQERYIRQGWSITGEDLLCTAFFDGPLLYAAPTPQQRQHVRDMAGMLRIPALLTRSADTLSQGQLRLLLLGRALLRQAPLLLLDEYTDGVDAGLRARLMDVLEQAATRSTLVVTAHRADTIPVFVQRRLLLRDGTLTADMPPQYLLRKTPPSPNAEEPASPARSVHAPRADTPPLLQLRHATVYVDRSAVLHDITWTWRHGEHWMLHGGNGAGKSTLLRLLAGDEYPAHGGDIQRFLPRHGGAVHDLESIRRGVRLVSDAAQAAYGYDLTGLELVLSGFDNAIGTYRAFTPAETREARHWMLRLHVAALESRHIHSLSTGQLRRLLLARALVGKPDMLLLDEPCSGLDADTRRLFLDILQEISTQGVHLALVSHHAADRIPAINRDARLEDGQFIVE